MSVEVEVSSKTLHTMLALLGVVIVLAVGYFVTPMVGGQAALLTPRTREIVRYRRAATGWLDTLADVDESLADVLAGGKEMDLLERVQTVSRAQAAVSSVLRGIDRTAVPATMTALNADIVSCTETHLDAVGAVEAWVNEPVEKRAKEGRAALRSADACLERLRSNHLLQEE